MFIFNTISANYPYLAVIVAIAYFVGSYLLLMAEEREPAVQFAWLFLVWAFPLFGLILYFVFGRDWRKKGRSGKALLKAYVDPRMGPLYEYYKPVIDPLRQKASETGQIRLINTIEALNYAEPLPVRDIKLYSDGQGFFDAICDDMAKAEKFIHHQYFIWENDELTQRMVDIMIDRLKAGVEVRLMYDWLGSIAYKKTQVQALKAAGGVIFEDMKHIDSMNYRNHRKITVIDGEIGYNGGFNVGQEYIDGGKGYPAWRDSGVRYTGPGVGELQKWFATRWYVVLNEDLLTEKYLPAYDPELKEGSPTIVQLVAQAAEDPYGSAALAHMVAMGCARKTLRIQSPYFVPDAPMLDAMIAAALSGVDVQFMMTGIPDHQTAFLAARTYYPKLIEAGARVFLYNAGFFHAKTMSVDGEYCAVGTMNMDRRSFDLQKEMMTWVHNGDMARQLEAQFDVDLQSCSEVTMKDIDAYTWGEKIVQRSYRLLSHLL